MEMVNIKEKRCLNISFAVILYFRFLELILLPALRFSEDQ